MGAAASADAALLLPAAEYVAIRSLSFPAAFLAGVLQASLLGAKDSLTPLLAVAASTLVHAANPSPSPSPNPKPNPRPNPEPLTLTLTLPLTLNPNPNPAPGQRHG